MATSFHHVLLFQFGFSFKSAIIKEGSMERTQPSKGAIYKQNQLLGYKGPGEKIQEEDIISAIKYDHSGSHLALGDQAGRIIVFESKSNKKKEENLQYLAEFQSHTKEFDYLRSMEVEEAITAITWQPPQGKYLKLLTTNSRSIKSWKIYEKAEKKVTKSAGKELCMPKLQPTDSYFAAKLQYTFPLKHHSSINSISTSGNEEYLLSSDDFHCLLWSYERPDKPFQLADLLGKEKPEDVEETITFSKMHPTSDSMFVYGTNKGILKLCDLRQASNSDPTAAVFKSEYAGNKNFLASTLSSYSSADFTKQGKYVVSRDYLTAKIWDVCNTKKPVISVPLNDGFKGKLSQMFQNQAIFDKFTIRASPDGSTLATGSYNNWFHMVDQDGTNTQYELNYKKLTIARQISGKVPPLKSVEYVKKTTALDFHPTRNTVAVASLNCFFIYSM